MKKLFYLSGLPLLLLGSCNAPINVYSYNSEGYIKRTESVTFLENITSINVNWVGGKVLFEKIYGEDQRLYIEEKGNNKDEYPLYYKVEGTKLTIHALESGTSNEVLNDLSKNLTVGIPDVLKDIAVNTIDTDVKLEAYLDFKNASFASINGSYTFGSYESFKTTFDCVNTKVICDYINCPLASKSGPVLNHEVDIDAVDCDFTFTYTPDESYGFEVKMKGTNNTFGSNLSVDNALDYGEKHLQVDFDGVNSKLVVNNWSGEN